MQLQLSAKQKQRHSSRVFLGIVFFFTTIICCVLKQCVRSESSVATLQHCLLGRERTWCNVKIIIGQPMASNCNTRTPNSVYTHANRSSRFVSLSFTFACSLSQSAAQTDTVSDLALLPLLEMEVRGVMLC